MDIILTLSYCESHLRIQLAYVLRNILVRFLGDTLLVLQKRSDSLHVGLFFELYCSNPCFHLSFH